MNALANFTFLTQDTNLKVSDRLPEEYLVEYAAKHPGALESHWIPPDRDLWRLENYPDFLAARRELLADAANAFLDSLYHGQMPEREVVSSPDEIARVIPGSVDSQEEEQLLIDTNTWGERAGLARGRVHVRAGGCGGRGASSARPGMAQWTSQEGLSQPVALLLDEPSKTEEAANRAGYRFFTSEGEFKAYVEREILALSGAAA